MPRKPGQSKAVTSELTEWTLDRLHAHPRQHEFYEPLSDVLLDELAKKYKSEGMPPVDVLPNGTILDGHQRWLVAQRHKMKKVPVRIRRDLVAAGKKAIELFFLSANRNRHHLSDLRRIRIELAALTAEGHEVANMGAVKLSNLISERLPDLKPWTVKRELRVLKAPPEIQHAYEAELLPRDAVPPLLKLEREVLEPLLKAIRKKQSAEQITAIARGLRKSPAHEKKSAPTAKQLVRYLEKGAELANYDWSECLDDLSQDQVLVVVGLCRDLLEALNKRADQTAGDDRNDVVAMETQQTDAMPAAKRLPVAFTQQMATIRANMQRHA